MIDRTYRVSDVVNNEFLRLPLSLLANPQYRAMSLEAKFIYSLLLNRMTLSQRNDWVNEDNEVYLIYTREEAASTLNISYKKAIAAFKELIGKGLLFEQRQGRGYPNLLYVLKAELNNEDAAEFDREFHAEPMNAEPEALYDSQTCSNDRFRPAETAHQDMPKSPIKICQNGTSRPVETAVLDMPKSHPSQIENINIYNSQIENSPSIHLRPLENTVMADGQTDEQLLQRIWNRCGLEMFRDNIRVMLEQAIERLFYSESLKIGNARLPKEKIRGYLSLLDEEILISVLDTVKKNEETIVNPTAYLMSTIINAICEQESEVLLNLPARYISERSFYAEEDERKGGEKDDDKPGSKTAVGADWPIRGDPRGSS